MTWIRLSRPARVTHAKRTGRQERNHHDRHRRHGGETIRRRGDPVHPTHPRLRARRDETARPAPRHDRRIPGRRRGATRGGTRTTPHARPGRDHPAQTREPRTADRERGAQPASDHAAGAEQEARIPGVEPLRAHRRRHAEHGQRRQGRTQGHPRQGRNRSQDHPRQGAGQSRSHDRRGEEKSGRAGRTGHAAQTGDRPGSRQENRRKPRTGAEAPVRRQHGSRQNPKAAEAKAARLDAETKTRVADADRREREAARTVDQARRLLADAAARLARPVPELPATNPRE